MADDEKEDPQRPARLEVLFRETGNSLDRMQKLHSENAKRAGYARDVIWIAGKSIGGVPDNPIFAHTEERMIRFRSVVEAREKSMGEHPINFDGTAFTIVTTTSSASPFVGIPLDRFAPAPPPYWGPDRDKTYAEKLDGFDKECGSLYRGTWNTFYGTPENSERIALALMRQLFDHFFGKLAPNSEVEQFKKSTGEDPSEITRSDRIRCAARNRIKDPVEAQSLADDAKYVASVYHELNILHARKPLDRESVRKIISSMRSVIERWIDAL